MKDISKQPIWQQKRLGDIVSVYGGSAFPVEYQGVKSGELPFFKVSDMNLPGNEVFMRHANNYVSYEVARKLRARIFLKGAIIFPKIGAAIYTNKKRILTSNSLIDNNVMGIWADDDDTCFPEFLYMFLEIIDLRDLANYGPLPSITGQTVKDLTICLPTFQEQVAISKVLQTVQEAIEARRDELKLERERKSAQLEHLFTHGTHGEPCKQTEIGEIPESWQICRLEDIAQVAYGLTVNQTRRKSTQLAPYLTVANVSRGFLRLEEVKQIGMLEGDADRYRLQKGDVLMIEGNGNPALLGSAAVWNDELPFSLHQNHLIRARPDPKKVLPNWLMEYLNSDNGRAQLLGRAKTSSGLHSINSRIVENLYIPLPSLLEQQVDVEAMQSCNLKIASLEQETFLLKELFLALIEELMTGRISTLPLLEEESHE